MLWEVWSKYINTLFLISSGLLQKFFVVYSHVFFNVKNRKISFISKRKKHYVTFFYYISFIRELALSKSTRNYKDNEREHFYKSDFGQCKSILYADYTLTIRWLIRWLYADLKLQVFSRPQIPAWFRIFIMLLKNIHWGNLKAKKRNRQIP